jgi:transmembrane sensor
LLTQARAADNSGVIRLWSLGRIRPPRSGAAWHIRVRGAVVIAATAAALCMGFIWMDRDGQRFGVPKEFVAAHGEQRFWRLPDGSGLDLNEDSAVLVHYSKHERLVKIERGQALFQVAHESSRRFRVVAGDTGVVAVGTEFEVLRNSGSTVVIVVQGKVAVFSGDPPPASVPAVLPSQALSVTAGKQVQIDDHAHLAKLSVATVNVSQAMAWLQRKITFDRQPLGDVAAQFSPGSSVPIVIEGSRLRNLPISGVFNEYDAESFLAFIARLDNVEIENTGDRVLVREKPDPSPKSPTPY